MKKNAVFYFFIGSLLCCSCQGETPLLYVARSSYDKTKSFDDNCVLFDPIHVKDEIEKKATFFFYFGSKECPSCENLQPLISRYMERENITLYYLDLSANNHLKQFQEYLEPLKDASQVEVFRTSFTPTFYFFQNGSVIPDKKDDTDPHRHGWNDYASLKAYLKKRVAVSQIKYRKETTPIENGILFHDNGSENLSLSQDILKNAPYGEYQSAIFSSSEEGTYLEMMKDGQNRRVLLQNEDWNEVAKYWEE